MSYNGGVSYKGDKALAQEALPECLLCYNIVEALRTSAGLTELEKTFDLEGGGTVRIVVSPNVTHMYIDVAPVEVGEDPQYEVKEQIDETIHGFVIHSRWKNWSDLPIEGMRQAFVQTAPSGEGEWNTTSDEYLREITGGEPYITGGQTYPSDRYMRYIIHIRSGNTLFWTPTTASEESKYRISYNSWIYYIYWHDDYLHTVRRNTSGSTMTMLGYGVFKDKKFIVASVNRGSSQTRPDTAKNDIEFWAYDYTPPVSGPDGWVSPPIIHDERSNGLGVGELIATIPQDWYEYRITPPITPEYSFDGKDMYATIHGSLWFNFSEDGTKCIRCKVLSDRDLYNHDDLEILNDPKVVKRYSFKEELTFEYDEDYEPPADEEYEDGDAWEVVRTIEDTGATAGNVVYENTVYDTLPYIVTSTPTVDLGGIVQCPRTGTTGAWTTGDFTIGSTASAAAALIGWYETNYPSPGASSSTLQFVEGFHPSQWGNNIGDPLYVSITFNTSAAPTTYHYSEVALLQERLEVDRTDSNKYEHDEHTYTVLGGYRPTAYDYDAGGNIVEFGLEYDQATCTSRHYDTFDNMQFVYSIAAGGTIGPPWDNIAEGADDLITGWPTIAYENPALEYSYDYNVDSSIDNDTASVRGRYTHTYDGDEKEYSFPIFSGEMDYKDVINWREERFSDGTGNHVDLEPLVWEKVWTCDDDVYCSLNRGGLTAMDLRNGVFITSTLRKYGEKSYTRPRTAPGEDFAPYVKACDLRMQRPGDVLYYVKEGELVIEPIPKVSYPGHSLYDYGPETDFDFGADGTYYENLWNTELHLRRIGFDMFTGDILTSYGSAYYSARATNCIDGTLQKADDGSICFQVTTKELAGGWCMMRPYSSAGDDLQAQDGMAAFVYHSDGDEGMEFTSLHDIIGVTVNNGIHPGDYQAFHWGNNADNYAVCRSISYVIIEIETPFDPDVGVEIEVES